MGLARISYSKLLNAVFGPSRLPRVGLSGFAGVPVSSGRFEDLLSSVLKSSTPLSRLVNGGAPSVSASPKKNESADRRWVAVQPVVGKMDGKGVRATTGAKKRGEDHGQTKDPFGRECTSILY